MFDINLVPEVQKQKQAQVRKNTYAVVAAVGILGVVVLALVVLGSMKVASSVGLNSTKKDIEEVERESAQYKELEEAVVSLEAGLDAIKHAFDGKDSWTSLLPHLEQATPNDVSYRKLTVEGNTVKATLAGKSVDSVARFLKSYENYQVVVLKGQGTPQSTVKFNIDGADLGAVAVKSDGSWIKAIRVSSAESFVITVSGGASDKIVYTAADKSLRSESGHITTGIANLFRSVSTKQYTKEGSNVVFDATYTVATEVLW